MKDNTKRLLLIGGSILVIGGVAYYFYNKRKKEVSDPQSDADQTVSEEITPSPDGGGGVIPSGVPVEINSLDKAKKFQDFMDKIGPWVKGSDGKYKKLNKGAGYGITGPSTLQAFNVYGDLYRVYLRSGNRGIIVPIIGSSPAAIDINLSNGTIARYQQDKKFVHFASAYGSAINTGNWTKGGRKITLTFGPKIGKTYDKETIWDALKELIS
jgi:hypothetical protein